MLVTRLACTGLYDARRIAMMRPNLMAGILRTILNSTQVAFTEIYLVNISGRERSDSQERSKIGDRTDGS